MLVFIAVNNSKTKVFDSRWIPFLFLFFFLQFGANMGTSANLPNIRTCKKQPRDPSAILNFCKSYERS